MRQVMEENDIKNDSQINNEDTSLIKRKIFNLRLSFFITLFVLSGVYRYFASTNSITNDSLFIDFLPGVLGSALAFGFIPAIIALIRKLIKKTPNNGIYVLYFILIIIFFFLSFIPIILRMSSEENSTHSNKLSIQNEPSFKNYIFSSSEYSVVFQGEPKVIEVSVPFNGSILKGKSAELVILQDKSFCRAEYVNFGENFNSNVNRDYVYNYLNNYSVHTGLSYPTFTYEENDLGKVGSIRAYKTLVDDSGNSRKITYFSKAIYGSSSVMILYVGSPSENYPTSSISSFLRSITKL